MAKSVTHPISNRDYNISSRAECQRKKYPCQAFYCLINTPVALHTWFVVNVIAIFSILFVYFVVSVAVPFQGILSHGIYCIYLLVFNEFLICNFANQFLIVLMFYSYYIYIHHQATSCYELAQYFYYTITELMSNLFSHFLTQSS